MQKDKEKEQIKQLWSLCFSDTEEFIDFYFSEVYDKNIVEAIENRGEVISAAQSIPEILSFGRQSLSVGYIYGACTHPSYRRRGYMETVLSDIHKKMFLKDNILSILVPASPELFKYYSKLGYATCFYQKNIPNINIELADSSKSIKGIVNEGDIYSFEDFYKLLQEKESCRIMHVGDNYVRMRGELSTDNGECLGAISESNQLVAIAFVTKNAEKKEMLIKECLGLDDYSSLFYNFLKEKNDKKGWKTNWRCPSTINAPYSEPYAMARIIDTENMLQLWAQENRSMNKLICIKEDSILPINNGTFLLSDGKCSRCEEKKEAEIYTIPTLTKEILIEKNAQISLMMD